MSKSARKLITMITAFSIAANFLISTPTVKAASKNNVEDWIHSALTQKTFYHYNMAYAAILKVDNISERDKYLCELAPAVKDVWSDEIGYFVSELDKLSKNKSAKLYDELEAKINNSSLNNVDKQYLLNELCTWGRKLIWTEDYRIALDSLLVTWKSKSEKDIKATSDLIEMIKNPLNKEYLQGELEKIKTIKESDSEKEVQVVEETENIDNIDEKDVTLGKNTYKKDLIIYTKGHDVHLNGTNVDGNLIIEGTGAEKEVNLDGVTVKGDVLIKNCGKSFKISNCNLGNVTLTDKVSGYKENGKYPLVRGNFLNIEPEIYLSNNIIKYLNIDYIKYEPTVSFEGTRTAIDIVDISSATRIKTSIVNETVNIKNLNVNIRETTSIKKSVDMYGNFSLTKVTIINASSLNINGNFNYVEVNSETIVNIQKTSKVKDLVINNNDVKLKTGDSNNTKDLAKVIDKVTVKEGVNNEQAKEIKKLEDAKKEENKKEPSKVEPNRKHNGSSSKDKVEPKPNPEKVEEKKDEVKKDEKPKENPVVKPKDEPKPVVKPEEVKPKEDPVVKPENPKTKEDEKVDSNKPKPSEKPQESEEEKKNTEPSVLNEVPVIEAKDVEINEGDIFNEKSGLIKAIDKEDKDLTSKVTVKENTVNAKKAGVYKVVYEVKDSKGAAVTKEIKVTVKEAPKKEDKDTSLDITDKKDSDTSKEDDLNKTKPSVEPEDSVKEKDKVSSETNPVSPEKDKEKEDVSSTPSDKDKIKTEDGKDTSIEDKKEEKPDTVEPKKDEVIPSVLNEVPVIEAKDVEIKEEDTFDEKSGLIKATDKEDKDLTSKVTVKENTVNAKKAGVYKVVYEVKDSKGAAVTKEIKVTVKAVVKPTLLNEVPVIEAKDVEIEQGDNFNEKSGLISATDKEDKDLTSKVTVKENTVNSKEAGVYKVVYEVKDSNGATVTKEIKVTVNAKNEVPVIEAKDVEIKEGDAFDEKAGLISATDKEDKDLTSKVTVKENTVNAKKAGVYKVVYEVKDSKGAIVTKEIKVTVKAKTPNGPIVINSESEFYNALKEGLERFDDKIILKVTNYNSKTYDLNIINKILIENPTISYGYNGCSASIQGYPGSAEQTLTISVKYAKDKDTMIRHKREAEAEADRVIAKVIKPGMNDFQKELALHDYLVESAEYDTAHVNDKPVRPEDHNPYGILVEKTGVCESYAKAFSLLLNKARIENKYVTGYGSHGDGTGERHGWSMVKLDGEWYCVDVTWDDPIYSGHTKPMLPISHKYFNLTDAEMGKDHRIEAEPGVTYPSATGTKYSFTNMIENIEEKDDEGNVFKAVKSLEELDNLLREALNSRKGTLSIKQVGMNMSQQELINESGKIARELNLRVSLGIKSMNDGKYAQYSFKF